ncbi:MAG TPA: TonB-dependent receptor, partial [Chitinophagaceae bacterium]|nr:TonB-dependent receptor [Chitinophagaceae bacterium]
VSKTDGSFAIQGLPAGIYVVNITATGFASIVDTADLSAGDATVHAILSASYNNLDEVVVSAEKLEEKIQRVPSAVSAFNARQVNEFRLWNINQISGLVPNLYSANSGDYRNVSSIRGITTTSYEQAVATYVDGVNQFSLDTYIPQLFDVERIEILRGPQGTLYGRNAMGGVINIITKKPQNKLDAYTELSIGDYGQQRFGGSVKFPLIADKLFFGAAAVYDQRKGYYTNEFSNTDFDRQKQITGNYYLQYYPASRFHAVLNVKHQNNRNNGPFPLSPDKSTAFESPFKVNQNATTTMQDDNINASLALHYDPTGFRITSLTAWQNNYRIYRRPIDGDFSPLDAITIINDYGKDFNKVKVFTEELRIQSKEGSKVKWTGGLFFFKQDNPTKQGTHFGADAPLLGIPDADFTLINTNKGENSGVAFFGQLTYPIAKRLELTLGLRYDNENRKLTVAGEYQKDPDPAFPILSDTSASDNYSAFSPKAGLQYNLGGDNMIYLSYSRGYRAGGLTPLGSDPSQVPLSAFDPEYSNNVEFGWKNFLLNHKLKLNATLFYSFVENVQVPTLILPDAITVVRNSGKMTTKGIELEVSTTPVNGLELMFNGGLTDASYSSLSLPKDGVMVNYDGNNQVFTPSYTSLLMGQYTLPIGQKQKTRLMARVEWISFGKQFFDLANTISQDPYSLLHSRIGVSTRHLEVYVWGRNLGNTKYIAYGYDFGGVHLGNPRTVGTTVVIRL